MNLVERARRLLAALDDLAGQEAVLLRSLDLVEAIQISERCSPLVDEICRLASEPEVQELHTQVGELLALRQRNAALLESHLSRVQEEIRRVDESRRRVARTAPVYRSGAIVEPSPTDGHLNTAA